jgi:hypothetical protein
MNERNQAQSAPFFGCSMLAINVGKDISNVVLYGSFEMSRAWLTPDNSLLPCGVGGDSTFKVGFQCKG